MFAQNMAFSPGTLRFYRDIEPDYEDLSERLRKTLYYGKLPGTDRPSHPLTDLGVEFYRSAAPRELGKLDTFLAAATTRSACVSPTSMMVGMMYVRRLQKRKPEYLAQISSSELFLISMMMASKFLYDEGIDDEVYNDEWAVSGDLETEDVNKLEMEFLNAMDWELFVRPEEFADMLHSVEKRIALQEGLKRGWFSYTDMMILSHDLKLTSFTDLSAELSKVFSAASLAYLAGVLTMIGSTLAATATSTALTQLGTSALPACLKMTSGLMTLTLYPELLSREAQLSSDMLINFPEHWNATRALKENLQDEENVALNKAENGSDEFLWGTVNFQKPMGESGSPNKEPPGSLLNLLPPFLALLTFKEAVLNYVFGANVDHDPDIYGNDHELTSDLDTNQDNMGDYCSLGPCLTDSWSDCFNISSEHEWNEFKSLASQCYYRNTKQCCDKWRKLVPYYRCVNSAIAQPLPSSLNTRLDTEMDINHVKCCCRFSHVEASSWLKGSLSLPARDLNLRFSTQSFYPIFITT
ncbi:protein CNPPD1-like [Dreissena polymorpha]|uniref:Protein CNPPD1 n=1 Tax=Dreissena polymorpha TaxID=45954 RepID=A0A9D4DZA0_DREPO|nr:protein CNPPD1-like [Dreissena polymorpha]KAH3770847.1 hypothetical protein DPMN_172144 [Dreissena polymorpha]